MSHDGGSMIEVRAFATLRKLRPPVEMVAIGDARTIRDVTTLLEVPEEELAIILLNGRHATFDDPISAGDILSLFPPVGGG